MRGCFSLFTKEIDPACYRTGLLVASAEWDMISQARRALAQRWLAVKFAILAPQGFANELPGEEEVFWLEEVKANPLHSLIALRRRKFDLCVVVLGGRPTFRRLKFAAFLLNARRMVVYNETCDFVVFDRAHWKQILAHFGYRAWHSRPLNLFFPFGLTYLLVRTLWIATRARLAARKI